MKIISEEMCTPTQGKEGAYEDAFLIWENTWVSGSADPVNATLPPTARGRWHF